MTLHLDKFVEFYQDCFPNSAVPPLPTTPEDFMNEPLFERCAWRTGFRQLRPEEKLENGDVLLMSILGNGLNHVAIFLDGEVLHHLTDRLSCIEPYSKWLLKCTGGRYRYVS